MKKRIKKIKDWKEGCKETAFYVMDNEPLYFGKVISKNDETVVLFITEIFPGGCPSFFNETLLCDIERIIFADRNEVDIIKEYVIDEGEEYYSITIKRKEI